VTLDAIGDVDQADVGLDEDLHAAVEEGEQEATGAAGAARTLNRRRVRAHDVLARLRRRGEHRALALGLGALVGRQVPAPVRRVLAPDRARRLAEGRRRRGVDQAPHSRRGGGTDGRHRAVDVDAPHRFGILDAERVDAGDVEGQLGALHAAHQGGLVEHVAARHLGAAALQRDGGRVRAGERDDIVSARHQALDERAADHSAAARDEDARHETVLSDARNFSR
jgi:hypothetical protein